MVSRKKSYYLRPKLVSMWPKAFVQSHASLQNRRKCEKTLFNKSGTVNTFVENDIETGLLSLAAFLCEGNLIIKHAS